MGEVSKGCVGVVIAVKRVCVLFSFLNVLSEEMRLERVGELAIQEEIWVPVLRADRLMA